METEKKSPFTPVDEIHQPLDLDKAALRILAGMASNISLMSDDTPFETALVARAVRLAKRLRYELEVEHADF